jgi:hypothetical protein
MRRLLILLSLAVSALIALPSAAGAQGADVYGVGAGSISLGGQVKLVKFAFSGHTGPQGDFGQFQLTRSDPLSPIDLRVDADCVKVFPFAPGAGGYMSGPVKKVSPQQNVFLVEPGDHVVLAFNDFGEPSGLIPDEMNSFQGFPQICKTLIPAHHYPITQGNINVKPG